jgi:hypothetical protein
MMSALTVQICRAETKDKLQTVVGAALEYWKQLGYTKVNVEWLAPGADQVGVHVKKTPDGAPQRVWAEFTAANTAVLVLSKPA